MVFDEQGHFKHRQTPSESVENPGQFGGNVEVGTMGQTFENPMNPSENPVQNPVTQPQSGVNLKKSQEPIQNPVTPMDTDNSQIQNNGDTFDDWYNQ